MDRPPAIVRFETLSLIACLIGVVGSLKPLIFAAVLGSILNIALTLWISRGRSWVGRMVLTVWFGLGLLAIVAGAILIARNFSAGFAITASTFGLSLLTLALNLASFCYLWSESATAWLRARPGRA